MIHLLQKDYEYIQAFLTMNISDSKIVHLLNRASALQQLSNIIDSLKDGDKIGPDTSCMSIFFFNDRIDFRV